MIKFCYEPFKDKFFDCPCNDHATAIYNKHQETAYDSFIRGLINNHTLYLRTYYPFNLDFLNIKTLKNKSLQLLKLYEKNILGRVKKEYGIDILKIVYNATNDLLKIDLKTISI